MDPIAEGMKQLELSATERLADFDRPVLVAWGPEDRVMPIEHGRRLAEILPRGSLVEIPDTYTLIPEDQPALLAARIREFVADIGVGKGAFNE